MKKVAFLICFFIASNTLFAQNRQLDSLMTFIRSYVAHDTVKVKALNALSEQYQWTNFYSSLQYAEQALSLAEELHYTKGIATAKYLKGHCFWALGDSNIAIEMGLDATQLAEVVKSETILVEGYQVLARSYMDQTAIEKAQHYIDLAETLALKNKNWDQVSRIYNLAGVIQFVSNHTDSALSLYEKAIAIAEEHNLPLRNSARIVSNIGECYLKKNNQALAFTYFEKALSIARETGNRTVEAGTSSIVGVALTKSEKYKEAESYLKTALSISRELGLKRVTRHVYAGLSDLKARQGKTAEALGYMKNFYEVRDSLLNAAKTRQIVELEARHELEKKEQAIKLLEQEQHIQRIWRNILMTALIFVAIAAFLIYYSLGYREKKNREILNLEIDYLTRQHQETVDKYKISLLHEADEFESHDQKLLKKAISIVESNINDPQFGVEKMAMEMNMSRTNLHRKIKSITGFPPNELIRSIRLRKAARLILNKVDSVTQIALSTGFDDYSYFSKAFKKHFGVSPSNYEEHYKIQGQLDQELASSLK